MSRHTISTLTHKTARVVATSAIADDLGKQKEFIALTNADLKEREQGLKERNVRLKDIQEAERQYEERKAEMIKQEAILDEKIKLKKSLELQKEDNAKELQEKHASMQAEFERRTRDIAEKEALLDRSYEIDRERKRLLDAREEKIKTIEKRLSSLQKE